MKKVKFPSLSNRAKLFIAAGVIVAGTSGVAAFNAFQPTAADEMTPTQVKVEEHEQRLDKNEKDIADTKAQAEKAEQKADQASQDVQVVKERVTVIEKQAQAASPQTQQVATPSPSPTPQPDDYNSVVDCHYVTMEENWEVDCKTGKRLE